MSLLVMLQQEDNQTRWDKRLSFSRRWWTFAGGVYECVWSCSKIGGISCAGCWSQTFQTWKSLFYTFWCVILYILFLSQHVKKSSTNICFQVLCLSALVQWEGIGRTHFTLYSVSRFKYGVESSYNTDWEIQYMKPNHMLLMTGTCLHMTWTHWYLACRSTNFPLAAFTTDSQSDACSLYGSSFFINSSHAFITAWRSQIPTHLLTTHEVELPLQSRYTLT